MAPLGKQPPQERTASDPGGDASDDGRRNSAGRGHRRSDRPAANASGTASFRRCCDAGAAVASARRGQVHERFVRPCLCQDRQQQACCQPIRKTLHGTSLGEELGGEENPRSQQAHGSQLTAQSSKWPRRDSNTRPPGYDPGELPLLHSANLPGGGCHIWVSESRASTGTSFPLPRWCTSRR